MFRAILSSQQPALWMRGCSRDSRYARQFRTRNQTVEMADGGDYLRADDICGPFGGARNRHRKKRPRSMGTFCGNRSYDVHRSPWARGCRDSGRRDFCFFPRQPRTRAGRSYATRPFWSSIRGSVSYLHRLGHTLSRDQFIISGTLVDAQ